MSELSSPVAEQDAAIQSLGVASAAAAIRNGELTSEAYTGSLLRRAKEKSNLQAFITIDEDAALSAARDADKARSAGINTPLLGVPLGVKDSYLTKGLRTTLGISNLEQFVPGHDAEIVGQLRDAGAVIFGKNNLVEMSFGLTGDNGAYGAAKNPYNLDHVSGGSSSGSAAAVGGGIVPAALGGDTVGSIRVPASLCGVVGYKPTTGRWPGAGVAPIAHSLDTTGLLARSVEDCALLDAIVTRSATPEAETSSDMRGIRLAYAPRQFLELVDAEVEAQFRDNIARLRDAGAEIVEVDLGDDFLALTDGTTWPIFFHETIGAISAFLETNKIPLTFTEIHARLKTQLRDTWSSVVVPGGPGAISTETYEQALTKGRAAIRERFDIAFKKHGAQALLLPATPCPAPRIDSQWAFSIAGQDVSDLILAKHTVPASGAGLPGISIPAGLTRAGLPIGLEIDGPLDRDRELLDIARRAEAVLGPLSPPR